MRIVFLLRRPAGPDNAFTGTKSHGGHGAVFPTQNFHFSFPPSKKLPEDRKAAPRCSRGSGELAVAPGTQLVQTYF